jgi:hypothetical protein
MFFQVAVLIVISQLYRPIAGAVASQTVTHHTMTSVLSFTTTLVSRVANMINHIFSPQFHLSYEKQLSLQQETRPYVSGFPLKHVFQEIPT